MKKRDKKYFIAAWTTLNKRAPTSTERADIEKDHAQYLISDDLPRYVAAYRMQQQNRALEQRDRVKRKRNKEVRRLVGLGCRVTYGDVSC